MTTFPPCENTIKQGNGLFFRTCSMPMYVIVATVIISVLNN